MSNVIGTLQALREHMKFDKKKEAWVFKFDVGDFDEVTISLKPHEYDMALILEVFQNDRLALGPIPLKALIAPRNWKQKDRSLIEREI